MCILLLYNYLFFNSDIFFIFFLHNMYMLLQNFLIWDQHSHSIPFYFTVQKVSKQALPHNHIGISPEWDVLILICSDLFLTQPSRQEFPPPLPHQSSPIPYGPCYRKKIIIRELASLRNVCPSHAGLVQPAPWQNDNFSAGFVRSEWKEERSCEAMQIRIWKEATARRCSVHHRWGRRSSRARVTAICVCVCAIPASELTLL